MKREQKKNIENLEKELEEKKKIPKDVREKINSKIFENIAYSAIIIVYFAALNFGMANIPTDNYIFYLKIFSVMFLIITIFSFEFAYKKDKGELWLHAIEVLVVSVFTIYLIYFYSIFYRTYGTLLFSAGIIFLIYFAIKIVILQRRIEKEYKKSLIDIGEIVKKG